MKSKLVLLIAAVCCSVFLLGFMVFSPSTDGCPAGNTGSPSDGKDCSSCHKAKAKFQEGLITSNINGKYIPGKTYTITATLKGDSKAKKFGFQISPQDSKGKLAGKLIVTDSLSTKLTGNRKYIDQIKKGTDGNGSKTWSFDWTAPVKNSGDVTFYGSFLIGGKPETVYNSILSVKENK
jgi:hypothetical protein